MTAFVAPQELHDLAFRYALAVDNCDGDMLIDLFTAEGAVLGYGENPISFRGRDGLAQMIVQVDTAFQRTMHNVYNQTFERDSTGQVAGLSYCIASHILPGEDWSLLDMAIRYHNRYAQEGSVWKFSQRRLEILWVETRPVQRFSAAMMDSDLKEFQ
jgi:SnoaL-like domain